MSTQLVLQQALPVAAQQQQLAESATQYLKFSLGRQLYAFPLQQVREIIQCRDVSMVPMTPQFVRGIINLRGSVIPVLDLAARFSGVPSELGLRSVIVIVELDGVLAHPADGRAADVRRDNANTLDGYQTLRYSWVPVAYHPCATALEVFTLLRRNGLRFPFRPCGKTCAALAPGRRAEAAGAGTRLHLDNSKRRSASTR